MGVVGTVPKKTEGGASTGHKTESGGSSEQETQGAWEQGTRDLTVVAAVTKQNQGGGSSDNRN